MVRLATFAFFALLSCFGGTRLEYSGGAGVDVHVLVTRHALSWANIAAYWMKSMWHVRVRDPLLTQVGIAKSSEAGVEVEAWLREPGRNWTIDAVISSALVRAMETAMFQYPKQKVYVAPFIAETGLGHDNLPRESDKQIARLAEQLGKSADFDLDYQWSEKLKDLDSPQSWEKFLQFLQDFFLPDLLRLRDMRGEARGAPIVLAVVTHSNFMGEGEIKTRCSQYFPKLQGKRKPHNNQVFHLPYRLRSEVRAKWDSTVRHSLSPAGVCEPVAKGMPAVDNVTGKLLRFCKSDLGEDCYETLGAKVGSYPPTIDDDLTAIYEHIVSAKQKAADLQKELLQPKQTDWRPFSRQPSKDDLKGELDLLDADIAEQLQQMRSLARKPCLLRGFPADPESARGKLD